MNIEVFLKMKLNYCPKIDDMSNCSFLFYSLKLYNKKKLKIEIVGKKKKLR